jgi:uncharacterized protein YidB (DUF937 family)
LPETTVNQADGGRSTSFQHLLGQALRAALPETVNRLTPGGRLPDETEASGLI